MHILARRTSLCQDAQMDVTQAAQNIRVVLPTEHHRHTPEWEINNGEVVRPPFDRPERLHRIASALSDAQYPFLDATPHDLTHVFRTHAPSLVSFLEHAYEEWGKAGGGQQVIPDTLQLIN